MADIININGATVEREIETSVEIHAKGETIKLNQFVVAGDSDRAGYMCYNCNPGTMILSINEIMSKFTNLTESEEFDSEGAEFLSAQVKELEKLCKRAERFLQKW